MQHTFGQQTAANSCAAYISQTTVHWPNQHGFHLHTLQVIPAETVIWKADISVRLLCLVYLWNVFVFPSSAAHTNQHCVGVLCLEIVWKINVAQLFLCLSSADTEQTVSFVAALEN